MLEHYMHIFSEDLTIKFFPVMIRTIRSILGYNF